MLLAIETATNTRSPDSGYTSVWATGPTANGIKDPDNALVTVTNFVGKLYWRWVWVIYTTPTSRMARHGSLGPAKTST